MTDQVKRVYAFGKDAQGNNVTEGNTNMKAILGGKGANLAEMANIGLPVPPGFTISLSNVYGIRQRGITLGQKVFSIPSRNIVRILRTASVRRSAMQRIRCSSPFVPALLCPCRA